MKKALFILITSFTLAACTHAPSPQTTTPDKKANCAALKTQMMQDQGNQSNSGASAISSAQNMNYQETYKNECS